MTKGERLIWELFEMVRELMPATAQNAERFNSWAAKFHEMEAGHPQPVVLREPPAPIERPDTSPGPVQPIEPPPPGEIDEAEYRKRLAEPEPEVDEPDDEPDPDPHEHGVPTRPAGKRKKK